MTDNTNHKNVSMAPDTVELVLVDTVVIQPLGQDEPEVTNSLGINPAHRSGLPRHARALTRLGFPSE